MKRKAAENNKLGAQDEQATDVAQKILFLETTSAAFLNSVIAVSATVLLAHFSSSIYYTGKSMFVKGILKGYFQKVL